MKTWKRYERYLHSGEWHVHTSYTDGKNSVGELCEQALSLGIPLIVFTEHVRREMSYDLGRLLEDIDDARSEYPGLIILSGAEAKVLPDGRLDAGDSVLDRVDYPAFSFHSFPKDRSLYLRCLSQALEHERVNAWCHPCEFLRRHGIALSDEELGAIFDLMARKDVLLEINGKHRLPEKNWLKRARDAGVRTVIGSDVHELADFRYREQSLG